nr:hypothetical protein [uncultured Roseovarius sp.]
MQYSASELAYLRRKGAPEILNMPEPESAFFWSAYMTLRNSRTIGMAASGIPFTEITAYADHCGMTCPVERHRLVSIIGAMEAAEREVHGNSKPAP